MKISDPVIIDVSILLDNIEKLRTTELGKDRIRKNVGEDIADPVEWCKNQIKLESSYVEAIGKNYYLYTRMFILTINRYTYTIITVKKRLINTSNY